MYTYDLSNGDVTFRLKSNFKCLQNLILTEEVILPNRGQRVNLSLLKSPSHSHARLRRTYHQIHFQDITWVIWYNVLNYFTHILVKLFFHNILLGWQYLSNSKDTHTYIYIYIYISGLGVTMVMWYISNLRSLVFCLETKCK